MSSEVLGALLEIVSLPPLLGGVDFGTLQRQLFHLLYVCKCMCIDVNVNS